jgi:hypothetical protein
MERKRRNPGRRAKGEWAWKKLKKYDANRKQEDKIWRFLLLDASFIPTFRTSRVEYSRISSGVLTRAS